MRGILAEDQRQLGATGSRPDANAVRSQDVTDPWQLRQTEQVAYLYALAVGPVLVVRASFDQLGLWEILDQNLGRAQGVPFADRAFVLVANRLIAPASEHGLAGWLVTDFACDRKGRRFLPHRHQRRRVRVHPRQLDAWYRTLDQLLAAKDRIEVALYHRLRDLFSLKPALVLYDITSTYFEGTGPVDFATHGYSRDGKPRNVQVIVGVVMVAGWPIAHHVWAGNCVDHGTVQDVVRDLRQRFEFRRLVFVGDRGMVTEGNLESLTHEGQGFLVGLKRRRNEKLDGWLDAVDESRWIDCPVGIKGAIAPVPRISAEFKRPCPGLCPESLSRWLGALIPRRVPGTWRSPPRPGVSQEGPPPG